MIVELLAPYEDAGTIQTFVTGDGRLVAVDHRMARAMREALQDGPVAVTVEPYQIVGAYLDASADRLEANDA
jgi:hypothetical protein